MTNGRYIHSLGKGFTKSKRGYVKKKRGGNKVLFNAGVINVAECFPEQNGAEQNPERCQRRSIDLAEEEQGQ